MMLSLAARLASIALFLAAPGSAQKATLRGARDEENERALPVSMEIQEDDDYPHLLECLVHSNDDEACSGVSGGCVWCTSLSGANDDTYLDDGFATDDAPKPDPSGSTTLCVSEQASETIMKSGEYDCTSPVPDDDDTATADDDATSDDSFTPDLFECLSEGAKSSCQTHTTDDGSKCVWCEEGAESGICLSDEAAKAMDGFAFHCLFTNPTSLATATDE